MRAIIAVSRDGYVARSDRDTMGWTGAEDKAVFRLLTSVGGTLGVSHRTAQLMPSALPGRKLYTLSRNPVLPPGYGYPVTRDLDWFQNFNNPWLIGGQALIASALKLDMVTQLYVCRSGAMCDPTPSAIPYTLNEFLNSDCWSMDMTVPFFHGPVGVRVEVWNRKS